MVWSNIILSFSWYALKLEFPDWWWIQQKKNLPRNGKDIFWHNTILLHLTVVYWSWLALPRSYTNFLKSSFKYSGAMLCNSLSYETKTAQSPSVGSHWFHVIYFLFKIFHQLSLIHIYSLYCNMFIYAPPGNQLLLCVASIVK